MDYLVYVEGNAEYLQFFLWYCDYVHRWSTLSRKEKALSRRWDPDGTRPTTSHSRSGSLEKTKVDTILDILDNDKGENDVDDEKNQGDGIASSLSPSHDEWAHQKTSSTATNFSLPRQPAPVVSSMGGARNLTATVEWLPCKLEEEGERKGYGWEGADRKNLD